MTHFITGIAGFIGFHLASSLSQRGDYVIGCDNFNNYYTKELKKKRAALLREQGIEVIECDLIECEKLKPLFEKKNFSHLIHLAAQAGVRYSLTHPHAYRHSNLDGAFYILEMCRHYQPLNLIFASSSSVYGSAPHRPFQEDDPTDHPVSLYAATKKAGELLAQTYHHLYSIPTTILRFFTVYGPWGRPDMAYFSFAEALLNHQPIHLFNEGNMHRDFTYIDDIVQGIIGAIDRSKKGYEVYNLGKGTSETLMHLIECLESSFGKKAHLIRKPMQAGDVPSTWASTAKAQKELQFTPMTSLSEGIDRFADWYLTSSSQVLSSR